MESAAMRSQKVGVYAVNKETKLLKVFLMVGHPSERGAFIA